MSYFIDPFIDNIFMLNALVAGILVSIACGIVGTFTILRGLAFIGDALAHGVLPGVAIAMLFGFPGIIGASIGALGMVLGIGFITRKSNLSTDTAIGLLFVGMLALGVAIISKSHTFSGDLTRILFGEILGIGHTDIIYQTITTILIACTATIYHRPFLLLCFNSEQAEISGFSYRYYHFIMLVMIAITIIISFQTVGTLLVFGMLLAPAASAALFARKISAMVTYSIIIGIFSVYIGLLMSYYYNIAASSSVILVASTVFFISLLIRHFWLTYAT